MRNAGLDEAQAGIKIAGGNMTPPLWQKLKSLLMKVKESEKGGLLFNIQKTKVMASGPIISWQIGGETMEIVTNYFGELQNHCRW